MHALATPPDSQSSSRRPHVHDAPGSAGERTAVFAACSSGADAPSSRDSAGTLAADADPGSWPTQAARTANRVHSPLTQIDAHERRRARPRLVGRAEDRPGRRRRLVVDGVMFATSAWSLVYALDAATGAERWVYDPKVDRAIGSKACCDVVNRGVAFWGGRCSSARSTAACALDAASGKALWQTVTVDQSQPYTITGAPRVANGLVYIGNGGAEYGVRGYVSAYDADTGKLAWRFYTVPGDPAKGPDQAASDPSWPRPATWTGAVVEARRRRHGLGRHRLRPGVQSADRRRWQRLAMEPAASHPRAAATTCSSRRSSRSTPRPARTGGTTRRRPAIRGTTRRRSPSSWPTCRSAEGRARSRCRRRRTASSTSLDRENGRLISAVGDVAGADKPPGTPISWAYAIDPATGRPLENPEARYVKPALVRPGPLRRAQLAPDVLQPGDGPGLPPGARYGVRLRPRCRLRDPRGLRQYGTVIAPLPDDRPKIRGAIERVEGNAARVGSRGAARSLAFRARGPR